MKNKIKKITLITFILSIFVIVALIIAMVVNINKIYSEYNNKISISQKDSYDEELVDNYEEASSSIGATIEEVENEITNEVVNNKKEEEKEEVAIQEKAVDSNEQNSKIEEVIIKDPIFEKPIDGEIIKKFSSENLTYSETLKEWTTHMGIDISAELTTVVKASEEGTIKAIKNDPRYGITVIIEHVNGFETRYANLLTAEFVKEGEKVKKGQTIGTVGNTAVFEVADEPHLHFEILKNGEYLDPTQIINER